MVELSAAVLDEMEEVFHIVVGELHLLKRSIAFQRMGVFYLLDREDIDIGLLASDRPDTLYCLLKLVWFIPKLARQVFTILQPIELFVHDVLKYNPLSDD